MLGETEHALALHRWSQAGTRYQNHPKGLENDAAPAETKHLLNAIVPTSVSFFICV